MSDVYTIVVEGLEAAKSQAMWGTYGKSGVEPLRMVKLVDCETDHLLEILRTQHHIRRTDYETIIRSILKDRGVNAGQEETA
jgi:hypothetical protein